MGFFLRFKNFGPGSFLGVVGSPRDFLGFDFCPHSIMILITGDPDLLLLGLLVI